MKRIFYTLFCCLAAANGVFAQPGMDAGFGTGGKVTTNFGFGETSDQANALLIQPDGKIIVAGRSGFLGSLIRYNPDGSLDNGFGTGGKATTQAGADSIESVTDLLLLPDGRFLATGRGALVSAGTNQYYFVRRFLPDGSPDPAFANAFKAGFPSSNSNIEMQSTGKIIWAFTKLIAGSGTEIWRLLNNGAVDAGFPVAAEPSMETRDMVVLPTNEFLLAGVQTNKFALAKYSPDGVKLGITNLTDFGGTSAGASSIALQPDGKIILAGSASTAVGYDFAVARYNPDGSLDNSFAGGRILTDFAGIDVAEDVLVQPDGKIVVAGWRETGGTADDTAFASARYFPNGQLDPCYGTGGKLVILFPAATGSPAALQPDGKLVFAGFTKNGSNFDFAVARYNGGGTPTTWYRDFDGDGYGDDATAVLSCPQPAAQTMKIDPNCIDLPPFFLCPTKLVYWVSQGGDCDDNNFATHPGAAEICDGKDNDCDGQVDEGLPTTTYYVDADGDGYGTGPGLERCKNPGAGYATRAGDCNDANPAIHPDATGTIEICDGIDNDCDGVIDEGCSGKPTISISDVTVHESDGVAVLTVRLSYITSLQVKINYATLDGTAVSTKKEKDYKSIGNTMLTIPPGTLTTTITVPVYDDGKVENSEYFYVVLSKPTNCILGDVTGTVTILDGAALVPGRTPQPVEDDEPKGSFDARVYPNPSGSAFTLQLSGTDQSPVEVKVRNALGQVVRTLRGSNSTLRFGEELKAGIYFVEVQQGDNRKTLRLMKY